MNELMKWKTSVKTTYSERERERNHYYLHNIEIGGFKERKIIVQIIPRFGTQLSQTGQSEHFVSRDRLRLQCCSGLLSATTRPAQCSAAGSAQPSPDITTTNQPNPPSPLFQRGRCVCLCSFGGGGVEINNKVGSMDCAYICYWIEIRGIPNY